MCNKNLYEYIHIILKRISANSPIHDFFKPFYNDYETSYTTYINHARWHRYLRSDGLLVGGNRSTLKKRTCPT